MTKWRYYGLLLGFIISLTLAAGPRDDPYGGAICENTVSAWFVSDNTNVIFEGKSLQIENITEDQCKEICINNRDLRGRFILCASFTYDHEHFSCNIYKHRSLPDGQLARKYDPGKRYFEKFCIPEDLPIECSNTMFIRADESIIKGYAKNTSIVPSMEECASRCMREEFDCKSAMYFYEEGECITNIESAMTKPEDFGHPDDGDRVVYFQNGCTREIVSSVGQETHAPHRVEPTTEESVTVPTEESVTTIEAEPETEPPRTIEPLQEEPEESPKPRKQKGRRKSEELKSEEVLPLPDQEPDRQKTEEHSAEISTRPSRRHQKDETESGERQNGREFEQSNHREFEHQGRPERPEDVEQLEHRERPEEHEKPEKRPPKQHRHYEEETPEKVPEPTEEVVEPPTTKKPEPNSATLKEMEKELLDLLNESSDAVASLDKTESDGKQEHKQKKPKKTPKKQQQEDKEDAKKKTESDEEALKEMQEIREMLKERKKNDNKNVEEPREEEPREEEPPKQAKRPKESKRKHHQEDEDRNEELADPRGEVGWNGIYFLHTL